MITAIEAGISISIILVILGFLLHDKKGLAIIQMVWIWILVAFNNGGIDYDGNEWLYENAENISQTDFGLTEWLNISLSTCFYNNGFSYLEYTVLTTSIMLLVLYWLVFMRVNKCSLFLSLFMIYPLIYVIIHKRFTLAMMVVVIAFLMLEKGYRKISCIFILLSSGFHLSTLMMLPFLFYEKITMLSKSIWISILVMECILLYAGNDIVLLLVADESMKAGDYMAANISLYAGILYAGTELLMIFFTYRIVRSTERDNDSLDSGRRFIQGINVFSLLYCPLLFLNAAFFRYYRIVALTSFFFMVNEIKGSWNYNTTRYYAFWAYILLMVFSQSIVFTYGKVDWQVHLQTLFEYNKILQMIF